MVEGEEVEVTVTVSASTAIVESQQRRSAGEVQVEGRIESLVPQLMVGAQPVRVASETLIRKGGVVVPFADLAIGMRVHVSGVLESGAVTAREIIVQNTNTSVPVTVNGAIAQLSGTATAFGFVVDGRQVRGDARTAFNGPRGFGDLENGVRVNVLGSLQEGYVQATRVTITGPPSETAPPGGGPPGGGPPGSGGGGN